MSGMWAVSLRDLESAACMVDTSCCRAEALRANGLEVRGWKGEYAELMVVFGVVQEVHQGQQHSGFDLPLEMVQVSILY